MFSFEKIKSSVDELLALPGTQAEKEEAWVGIGLLILLSCKAEEIGEIIKLHNYLWSQGVKAPCFAPEAN